MTPLYIAVYSIHNLILGIFLGIHTHTYRLYSRTVHFVSDELVYDIQNIFTKVFYQQMHLLLKDKMLQFIFKISHLIWLLHVSVPSDHHQGAYDGTLPKLVSLKIIS